jgi:type IV secretory pathway ATPase VirB11/archaellum biosynthesis ATPase/intein/homing endonuclease
VTEKILESYSVEADKIKTIINIVRTKDFVPIYDLKVPEVAPATLALLDKVRTTLLTEIPVKTTELMDPSSIEKMKKTFYEKGSALLQKEIPTLTRETRDILIGLLIQEMFGLGRIEFLLADPNVEEVVVNGTREPVWVYHKKFGWLKTTLQIKSENDILNYANNIGRKVGRQITILNPLMDAHLPTGDRVNATLFPISTFGNTITIRKFRRSPWTIVDFIENKTLNYEVAAWIWLAVQYELNMIVTGGTATGKTSLLNVFMNFIPPNHRVLSIEDSVSGEEEILLKEEGKIRRAKIKELLDASDEAFPANLEVLSINKEGKVEFRKVRKILRHKVKKPLYEILLASGKKIKTTGDHSLFSLSQDLSILPVKVQELREGSYIATPRHLVLPDVIDEINLIEVLKDPKVFVKGEKLKDFLNRKEGRRFLIENIPTKLRSKGRFYRTKGVLPISLFRRIKNVSEAEFEDLYVFKGRLSLPVKFKIDKDFAFLLGCWIGDGCYDKNSIIISISDEEFLRRLENFCKKYGISPRRHSDGFSFMINSSLLKQLMVDLGFVGNSFTKRVPEIVFSFRQELKSEFLKGLFSAEGRVSKSEIKLSTYSTNLANDLETLLLNFGIVMRKGFYKDKQGKQYWECRISSKRFLENFARFISFEQEYKKKKLNELLCRKLHEVADIIPLPKHVYRELKHVFRNSFNSYSYWKSWHRLYLKGSNLGREHLLRLVNENMGNIERLNNPVNGKKLIELVTNDIFWDKVKEIRKIDFEGYVYDLSVEENENFICNNVLAHNTRELQLPEFLHWVPLTTREPNPEGLGGVSMLDLLVNSLRMRPDRIIVGEIRRAREAEVLFEAMHTGHSVYATLHADTAEQALKRLCNPPINVPETVVEALHMFAVAFRDRRTGIRRMLQLSELVPRGEKGGVTINTLYRWRPAKDEIEKANESYRILEEIRMHTGMSDNEVKQSLEEKIDILKWLVKSHVSDINKIGRIVAIYYSDPEFLLKRIKESPEKVIEEWLK